MVMNSAVFAGEYTRHETRGRQARIERDRSRS